MCWVLYKCNFVFVCIDKSKKWNQNGFRIKATFIEKPDELMELNCLVPKKRWADVVDNYNRCWERQRREQTVSISRGDGKRKKSANEKTREMPLYNGLSAHAKVWLLAKHCFATSSIFYQHITGSEPISLSFTDLSHLSHSLTLSLTDSLTHWLTHTLATGCIILSLTVSVLSDFLSVFSLTIAVLILCVQQLVF